MRGGVEGLLCVTAGWVVAGVLASDARADGPAGKARQAPAGLAVEFKVDPRLTRGLHLGDRWTAAPSYTANLPASAASLEVRAHGTDAMGRPVDVAPSWEPADPGMLSVTPAVGRQVTVRVLRAGESRLKLHAHGATRQLTVLAEPRGQSLSVRISQVEGPETPEGQARAEILKAPAGGASYALGVDLGRKLKGQSSDVDPDLVMRGLRDAFAGGELLLTEAELKAAIEGLQREVRSRQAGERRVVAEKNRRQGQAYLAQNAAREGVVTLPSGLQYEVLEAGEGARPEPGDTVACHYRGSFVDGREFDSSAKRKAPASFRLDRVIPGWREALQLMPVGSRWKLAIPAPLAYGESGAAPRIPPDSTLVFEIELVSIVPGAARPARQPVPESAGNASGLP